MPIASCGDKPSLRSAYSIPIASLMPAGCTITAFENNLQLQAHFLNRLEHGSIMRQRGGDNNFSDSDRIVGEQPQSLDRLCRRRFAEKRLLASSWFIDHHSVLCHNIIDQTQVGKTAKRSSRRLPVNNSRAVAGHSKPFDRPEYSRFRSPIA
jgi:hypothetical protein